MSDGEDEWCEVLSCRLLQLLPDCIRVERKQVEAFLPRQHCTHVHIPSRGVITLTVPRWLFEEKFGAAP